MQLAMFLCKNQENNMDHGPVLFTSKLAQLILIWKLEWSGLFNANQCLHSLINLQTGCARQDSGLCSMTFREKVETKF